MLTSSKQSRNLCLHLAGCNCVTKLRLNKFLVMSSQNYYHSLRQVSMFFLAVEKGWDSLEADGSEEKARVEDRC